MTEIASTQNEINSLVPKEVAFVEMKQWRATSDQAEQTTLATIGLGPCIGLTLYNATTKQGWMGHFANPVFEEASVAAMLDEAASSGSPATMKIWVRGGQNNPNKPDEIGIDFSAMGKERITDLLSSRKFTIDAADIAYDSRSWAEGATVQRLDVKTGEFQSVVMGAETIPRQLGALGLLAE